MTLVAPIVRVQREDFDPGAEEALVTQGRLDVGAVVSFVGLCRDEEGALTGLELEHYPGMAEAEIARVAQEALARWPLLGLTAIHRFGLIRPGERIVLVLAAARHRGEAFPAAEFMMDYLKTRAPFWKKAHFADGRRGSDKDEGEWVAARADDDAAAARWAEK
jgi:molybdopterin synthase catalytic subunit